MLGSPLAPGSRTNRVDSTSIYPDPDRAIRPSPADLAVLEAVVTALQVDRGDREAETARLRGLPQ
jgi:hypothetical protein